MRNSFQKSVCTLSRQLLSHLGGVRHYLKKGEKEMDQSKVGDGRFQEFHLCRRFGSVGEALDIFKEDELLAKPGGATF